MVITGTGAVTPLGIGTDAFWTGLMASRSGVEPVRAFDVGAAMPAYAAEVRDFIPERAGIPRKKLKMMGRQAQLAYAAVQEALADAALTEPGVVVPERLGIVLGVGMLNADIAELGRIFAAMPTAGMSSVFDDAAFCRLALTVMFPLWLLRHIPNLAAAHASIAIDAQGPSNTIATGCVAGANAIGEAARLVARGDADVIVAGGTDARVTPLATRRYRDLGWLATRDDCAPASVSAPFDEQASGFVNGEGAGVVVVEALDHADRRGARLRAEIVGYAAGNDAGSALRPDICGRALARALTRSIDAAGLDREEADVVFAPAPSVRGFDCAAAAALNGIFTSHGARPQVAATRSAIGHTHAASAALDCVAAVKALEHGRVPPVLNLRHPVANLAFARATPPARLATAVVAAYGFGGHAASIALRRPGA